MTCCSYSHRVFEGGISYFNDHVKGEISVRGVNPDELQVSLFECLLSGKLFILTWLMKPSSHWMYIYYMRMLTLKDIKWIFSKTPIMIFLNVLLKIGAHDIHICKIVLSVEKGTHIRYRSRQEHTHTIYIYTMTLGVM